MLMIAATLGDGTFEARWGGPLVLVSALGVRAVDGYLNIIVFHYIAHHFPDEEQAVTVVFDVVLLALSFRVVVHVGAGGNSNVQRLNAWR